MQNKTIPNREEIYKREEQTHDDSEFDENRLKEVNFLYENGAFDGIYSDAFSMLGDLRGKTVLEYGCGSGKNIQYFTDKGARYIGIDISNLRIFHANEFIVKNNLSDKATALKMNAEKLLFENENFDIVYGEAIIHHLDIDICMNEIKRVLKKNGIALFIEPRGENAIINRFRNKTPHLRTVDEHPLIKEDFNKIEKYFEMKQKNYFFLSLSSYIFRKYLRIEPLFKISKSFLDFIDSLVFAVIPLTRKYAWYCILKLEKS